MSTRQQDSIASRQAPKLPQFPARKTSSTSLGQSPGRRNRVDSLPGVVTAGRSPGRPDSAGWARTGAEKLLNLNKRNNPGPANDHSLEDETGGVDGFESPQLAKARAQVARDEVLSYMHHRRYQRKDAPERICAAPPEPRDTSFDDSDGDDDRARTAPRASPNAGDPTQLLHRVQQALDRWPPQNSFADDDLHPTSTDQSPTRHSRGFLEESAGSVAATAAAPGPGPGKRQGNMGVGGGAGGGRNADSSTGFSKVDDPGRQGSVAGEHSGSAVECASLSEDAFEFFKKEIAARVIQTHWRRWQRWKAKVRRDAEERILQQLLSDDSGLSLRMLLSSGGVSSGGGSINSGDPAGGGALGRERAGGSAGSTAAAVPCLTAANGQRPATAGPMVTQPNLPHQHGRAALPGRPAGGGGVLGSLGEDRRQALVRPASAAATTQAPNRGKSPARGRVTAAAAISSPARGARPSAERPGMHGGGSAGVNRGLSFDSDEVVSDVEEAQLAADGGTRKVGLQPNKRHAGGHAVYSFPATPQKRPAAPPPPAPPSGAAAPAADAGGQPRARSAHDIDTDTVCRPSSSTIAAEEDASVALGSSAVVAASSGSGGDSTAARDRRSGLPVSRQGHSPLSPPRQQHASLDADTNPVMASPALSAATEMSAGDSVLGPASPMPSVVESSAHNGRSQSTEAAGSGQQHHNHYHRQQQHQDQQQHSCSQGTRVTTNATTQLSSTSGGEATQQQTQQHSFSAGTRSNTTTTTSATTAQQGSSCSANPVQQHSQQQRQHTRSTTTTTTAVANTANTTAQQNSTSNANPGLQQPHQQQQNRHQQQQQPQAEQVEQRPYSRAGVAVCAPQPVSPTHHQPSRPAAVAQPQPDLSPSPQRQARMEALQRLKLHGSLRAGNLGAAAAGTAATRNGAGRQVAPGARPDAEAVPAGQPGAFTAFLQGLEKEQRKGQGLGSLQESSGVESGSRGGSEGLPRLAAVGDSWEAGVAIQAPGQPPQQSQLSPRELRARRQAWGGDGYDGADDNTATEGAVQYDQPANSEQRDWPVHDRERNQQHQQRNMQRQQIRAGGDADSAGGRRCSSADAEDARLQPTPGPPAATAARENPEEHPELSEEASLRALHEAKTAAAAGSHRRQSSGHAPRLQPPPPQTHESGALTPRGWGQDTGRTQQGRSAVASPRHTRYYASDQHQSQQQLPPPPQQQQDQGGRDAQDGVWEPHQRPHAVDSGRPDLLARNPTEVLPERAVPQAAAFGNHRRGHAHHAARPLSATAAENAARSHAAGVLTGTPPARVTLAGDDGSLAVLSGARGQLRDGQHVPQRPMGRAEAPATAAWPESTSARAGRSDLPDHGRERYLSPATSSGMSGEYTAGDETAGDKAGVATSGRRSSGAGTADGPGLGGSGSSSSHCGGRVPGSGDGRSLPERTLELSTPISGRHGGGGTGGGAVRGGGGGAGGGHGGGGFAGASGADPGVDLEASVTAERMSSILKYLEEVEIQAEQEATCASLAPALLASEAPATAAAVAAALLPGSAMAQHHRQQRGRAAAGGCVGGTHTHTRRYETASATSTGTRQVTSSSRPGTAHTGASHLGPQRSAAVLSDAGTVPQQRGLRRSTRSHHHSGRSLGGAADNDVSETGGHDGGEEDDDAVVLGMDDDAVSVATRSTVAGLTNRSAFLAESVYENVRAKIRRLQDDVKQRDGRINELTQEIESLQVAQRTVLLDADARLTEMLAAQRAEYEAAVSRHMAFVDRLLADKEALASRAEQLTEQIKAADERQERAIAKLKEGWAAELKRQKESWAAAEKQRREAWMQSKVAEIKDVTVKGLEGEVQKLLERHRAELSAAQKAAADEAKRHLDTYVAQNEAAVRQLKERLSREAEEAVEKERAAAATRLREVSERYEQQLQTQRMRLVADADLRLEQLEQARKEDKKRYEEAVAAAREAGEARLKDAEEDWRREKDAVRKAHEKQIDALREQYETGQEGWRAAMAERARKEVTERVAAIREKLLQERNEEVQAVMTRLEAEHAGTVEALKEDFRRREEAAAARSASALKEARRAEAKMAERFRNAGMATKTAEERLAASEMTVNDLRRELEARNNTIRWLEAQVSAAKDEAVARERDVRSLGAEKAAVAAEVAAAVARDKQQVEARLAQALQDAQELRARHSAEMAAVEARVRATLARKDEVISGLRDQLAAMASELRNTQEVLRQQQEELGSELDGSGGSGSSGRGVYGEAATAGRRGGRY